MSMDFLRATSERLLHAMAEREGFELLIYGNPLIFIWLQ